MSVKNRLSKNEIEMLLSTMVIQIDTREQKNQHITEYFDKQRIIYESKKLDTGDYSVKIPAHPPAGIMRDLYFDFAIERKANIDELAGNFKEERFENELIRAYKMKMLLIIEDSYMNLLKHNYRSQWEPKALLGKIISMSAKYNVETLWMDKQTIGNMIYHWLKYHVRQNLKEM